MIQAMYLKDSMSGAGTGAGQNWVAEGATFGRRPPLRGTSPRIVDGGGVKGASQYGRKKIFGLHASGGLPEGATEVTALRECLVHPTKQTRVE